MLDEMRGTGVRDSVHDGVRGTVLFSAVMRSELVRPSCGEGCLAAARNRLITAARSRLFCRREERAVSAVVQSGLSCRREEQADCSREEQTILPPQGAGCFGCRAERAVLPP
eukprot:COSAG05_NODE_389_length_10436_cov_116.442875_1_plen_112_part_00